MIHIQDHLGVVNIAGSRSFPQNNCKADVGRAEGRGDQCEGGEEQDQEAIPDNIFRRHCRGLRVLMTVC